MRFYSPLRYPGGKNRAIALFKDIIHLNNLQKCTYVEPFAGGASIALGLLIEGDVERIIINDADPSIYSFWISCLTKNEEFCELLINTKVTVDVWQQQKEIYQSLREDAIQGKEYDKMALGFATFFLNRTNRSGIIKGGVIGGHAQTGNYKIDARFNKQNLEERLKTIAKFADQVEVHCKDAKQFLLDNCNIWPTNTLIYCDPPYANTKKYESDFDHVKFWNWVRIMSKDGRYVYVSEYEAPSDFKCIWCRKKKDGMGTTNTGETQNIKVERLFVYNGKK